MASRRSVGRSSRTPNKGFGSSLPITRTTSTGRSSRTPRRQSRQSNRTTVDVRSSRGSLLKGGVDSQLAKDPRDLKSKPWQSSSISCLIDFLTRKGFKQSLTRKVLSSPSNREFKMIFEFMIRQLIPHYTLGATGLKLEHEVYNVFRDLGYNYMLNKQHLATVGAPHSWPYALGALDWLREVLEIEDAIENCEEVSIQSSFSDSKSQNPQIQHLFMLEEARGYAEYLQTGSNPSHEEFAEELDRIMLDGFSESDLPVLLEEVKKLRQALEERHSHEDNIHDIRTEMDEKLAEEHHLLEQQAAVETEMEAITVELQEVEEALEAARKRRTVVEADIAKVQEMVDQQPMRREDVEQLLVRRENCKAELEYQQRVNIDMLEANGHLERQVAGMMEVTEPKAITLVHLANELGVLEDYPDLQISMSQFRQAKSFIPHVESILNGIEDGLIEEKKNLQLVLNMEQRLAKQVSEEERRTTVQDQINKQQLKMLDEELDRVQERVRAQEEEMAEKRLLTERELIQLKEASLIKEKELKAASDRVRQVEETFKLKDAELASQVTQGELECRTVVAEMKRALTVSADFGDTLQKVASIIK